MVKSCFELLEEFKESRPSVIRADKLRFIGVGSKDVYNITPALDLPVGGVVKKVITGRVENRKGRLDSEIVFFEETSEINTWQPIQGAPVFKGEDPYIALIDDEIILLFVRSWVLYRDPWNYFWNYLTVFCRGKDVFSLHEFLVGPPHMKDIRLFSLASGNTGVFTRPVINGRKKVGYLEISDWRHLNEETLKKARLLINLTTENEWAGVSAPFSRQHDIGFLGHFACFDKLKKMNYFAVLVDSFDPKSFDFSPPRIIATRDIFLPGEAKRPDLENVVFPGGFVCHYNEGKITYYFGLNDVEAGLVVRQEKL